MIPRQFHFWFPRQCEDTVLTRTRFHFCSWVKFRRQVEWGLLPLEAPVADPADVVHGSVPPDVLSALEQDWCEHDLGSQSPSANQLWPPSRCVFWDGRGFQWRVRHPASAEEEGREWQPILVQEMDSCRPTSLTARGWKWLPTGCSEACNWPRIARWCLLCIVTGQLDVTQPMLMELFWRWHDTRREQRTQMGGTLGPSSFGCFGWRGERPMGRPGLWSKHDRKLK